MQVSSRRTTVYRDYEAERRRAGTLTYVLRNWFPANSESLANVRGHLNVSSTDPATVISELKLDLALCTRVISSVKSERGVILPAEDLRALSVEELRQLVPRSTEQISTHRLERGSALLCSQIATSLLSVTASETFAQEAKSRGRDISPDDAFGSSLLRQLGWNLLAWNYPSLFLRIVRGVKGAEREGVLRRVLGFSPLSLGEACARSWGISLSVLQGIENTTHPLSEICDLADHFGRRNQRALFPSGAKEWEERRERLSEIIGSEKTVEIEAQVESKLTERLHRVMRPREANAAFARLRTSEPKTTMISGSTFLKRLPEAVVREYVPIYERISEERESLEALFALTQRAIPASGFSRGLICILEDEKTPLRPAIRIGFHSGEKIDQLLSTAEEARESGVPLLDEEQGGRLSERRICISSLFKAGMRQGVLVLEVAANRAGDRDNIVLFKAARECLENCLK